MSSRSFRISIAAAASGAILVAASGAAIAAPGAPGKPQGASVDDRASLTQIPGRGSGSSGGNGGNRGDRPVTSNPIITPPSAPATPVAPVTGPPARTPSDPGGGGTPGTRSPAGTPSGPGGGGTSGPRPVTQPSSGGGGTSGPRPVTQPSSGGGDNSGGVSSGGSRNAAPAGGAGAAAPAVPKGLPVRGRSAGSGPVAVTLYMDLSDSSDAATYLSVTTALLARIASDRSATVTFSPIIMGSDSNSMEAAVAVLAGANQNRTWCVTAQLATLRSTRGGDWINRAALTQIARSCSLSSRRFVRDASGNRLYPRLNEIREQARADGVGATPSYVVKGNGGSRIVANPGSADAVASAIGGAA
ncbi:MAG: hypothetical protein FJW99_06645 [Actinobacteria bacterium]|nr:hypothetical protein [Actinomycetota bacterium]